MARGKLITSDSLSLDSKPSKATIAKSTFGNGNFGDAIRYMQEGGSARRDKWPAKLRILLNVEKDTIMKQSVGDAFVWDAIHADLLAKDWSSYS